MAGNTEKYAQWLVDNQDKKGTPEFETVAKAYKASKAQPESFMKQQFNELADVGVGALGQGAKFLGRILPGVTGEELQAKTERFLTPKGQALNPEAVEMGRTGADIAASFALPAGAGKLISKIPQAAKYAQALTTGGMDLGQATTKSKLVNALMRGGVGAAEGYGVGTLIDPENAGTGALTQGILANLPAGVEAVGRPLAKRFMQSAIKPQVKYLEAGDNVPEAIDTMLKYGVNPTEGRTIWGRGLDTLEKEKSRLNSLVDELIKTSPNTVSTQKALAEIEKLRPKMIAGGASPKETAVLTDFITGKQANPLLSTERISVPAAQEMKKEIYQKVGDLNYLRDNPAINIKGEQALARGLRKGISEAVPEVAPLNAEEAKIINALNVSERRALAEANKDLMGMSVIPSSMWRTILGFADRNSGFKAILARMMNDAANKASTVKQMPIGAVPAALASQGEE